jgi:hypothetical protein
MSHACRRLWLAAALAPVLLVGVTGCQRPPVDRGGAATGDDLGQESGAPGAGSAASNDSLLRQVPPERAQSSAHDETGRDTVRSSRIAPEAE